MPRVTPEHSAARRRQILEAARTCFLRDGFHQTSMQDIQREAGLSAGAIYLYFKGKNELISGIAIDILDTIAGVIPVGPVLDDAPVDLPTLLRVFLETAERLQRERQIFPLVLQVWAEGARNPAVLVPLQASIGIVRQRLQALLENCQARGLVRADADPAALAMAIIGLGQGYIVQRAMLGEGAKEPYLAGVDALLANAAPA